MRNPAAQGRADANHSTIRQCYEDHFCSVVDLHAVGRGVPDFLVGIAGLINELVEVKTEEGQLNEKQRLFQKRWKGSKVVVVRNESDVINHVYNIRERISRKRYA
jgi:hypothetical protein